MLLGIASIPGNLWLLPAAGLAIAFASFSVRRFSVALAMAGAVTAIGWLAWGRMHPAAQTLGAIHPVLATLAGIALVFLGILQELDSGDGKRNEKAGKLAAAFHFIAAGAFFADFRGYFPVPLAFGWVASLACLAIAADTLFHALVRVYFPADDSTSRSWFFDSQRSTAEPEVPASAGLAEMWMWPLIRPWLAPLGGVVLLLLWLSTTLHEISAGSEGVRISLGRFEEQALAPGLHGSLPWPFGTVVPVESARPREVTLGFRSDPGQPILWDRAHYIGEEMSLVGGGDDFLSISVPIFYHIGKPADFLRSSADPDALLRELAGRALLQHTVHRSAAEIMTGSRESIRVSLREALQAELDSRRSGLHVDDIYLRDIHPPVAVAPAYQEVVSAIEEKEATIHESEQYRLDHLPTAKGEARQVILKAEAAADARQLQARGQTERFMSEARARAQSPTLFETREGYRVFDAALAGAKKIITDESFARGAPLHLDLRRVLNRSLIDHAPPPVEPLIPNPEQRRDAFDLNVEGYR